MSKLVNQFFKPIDLKLVFSTLRIKNLLNPLTPGSFCQKCILWTFLEIFSLDKGQISSNLLKKAFATWQHVFLSTSIVSYNIFVQAHAEINISSFWTRKWPTSLGILFFIFFRLSFFSFSCLFAAMIDLLLGLLPVETFLRKHHRDGQFLPWSS